jgi:hypothetical protein
MSKISVSGIKFVFLLHIAIMMSIILKAMQF